VQLKQATLHLVQKQAAGGYVSVVMMICFVVAKMQRRCQKSSSEWAVWDYVLCFLATFHPKFSRHGVVAATSCNCLQTHKETNLAHNCELLVQPFENRQGKSVWLWST